MENCLVALEWARDNREYEDGLRLASALAPFWDLRGHASGGRRWLESLLRRAEGGERAAPAPLQARALRAAGDLAVAHNDFRRAAALFGAARELQLSHAATDAGIPPFDDYALRAHE